jgi:hypothetical protein
MPIANLIFAFVQLLRTSCDADAKSATEAAA